MHAPPIHEEFIHLNQQYGDVFNSTLSKYHGAIGKVKAVVGGGEIAQSLALVTERWNSITVLLTRPHQCRRLVQKRPSMCYYVCVIMHVKDP